MATSSLPQLARIFDAFLTGMRILVASAAVAIFGIMVYTSLKPAGALPDGLQFIAEIPVALSPATASLSDGTSVLLPVENARISVPIDQTPPGLRALLALCKFGFLAIVWILVSQLRQFVRSLREAHPFVSDNAARLRRVAWLIVSLGFWVSASQMLLASQFSRHFHSAEISFQGGLDWKTILFGLGIFIIAEVFRIGVAMKEEQDLTI